MLYRSTILNKDFETEEACLNAEKEYEDKLAAEKIAAEKREAEKESRIAELHQKWDNYVAAKEDFIKTKKSFDKDYNSFDSAFKDIANSEIESIPIIDILNKIFAP